MSQIHKLKNGSVIKAEKGTPSTPEPKQSQYGHLWVDGIDYGNSEDLYKAFAAHAHSQKLNQGEFYDQWLKALRSGQDVIFGNGNTVNLLPENMTPRRAGERSNWTKFWDDTFDNRRNNFSDAIATARGFVFTPKAVEPEKPKEKSPFDTSELILDYNDDPKKKGHRVWSPTHQNNLAAVKRVADAIAGLNDPDNSEYTYSDALKNAYEYAKSHPTEGFKGEWTPQAFADALFARLQDPTWTGYKNPDNDADLDWLKAFGIGVAPYTAPAAPAGDSSGGTDSRTGSTPKGDLEIEIEGVKYKKGPDGKYTRIESAPATQTVSSQADPTKPTLITPEMASANGWGSKYAFGLIHDGERFTPEEISRNRQLLAIMQQVEALNNQNMPQSERYEEMSKLINMPGIDAYADWTPGLTVKGLNLDDEFGAAGITSAAISDGTDYYDGHRTYKYFDNTRKGDNPWGFRTPYYLVYDKDGELHVHGTASDLEGLPINEQRNGNTWVRPELISSSAWNPKTVDIEYYPNWMGLVGQSGIRPVSGKAQLLQIANIGEHRIMQDLNGNYFILNPGTRKNSYFIYKTNTSFVDRILKGEKISQNDWLKNLEQYEPTGESKSQYISANKNGGTINFNKVHAFAKGGKVVKAAGGMNLDTSRLWTGLFEQSLGAMDYGSMAWGRKKVHDQIEQGLKDSLYKPDAAWLNGIPTITPIEDAAVNRYDQYIQRGLTTPLSADHTANVQNTLSMQGQALQGRDQAVRQQSAAALQRQMTNQQIMNGNIERQVEASNNYKARKSSLDMSLAQNDASLTAQTAQSLQNLAREWRTRLSGQVDKFNQLQYNQTVGTETELADNLWKNTIRDKSPKAWEDWNKMSAADRAKYGNDINTWIQQSSYWNTGLENLYKSNRTALNDKILDYYKTYNLSPILASLYRTRYGVDIRKSGGTLTIKPRNRYKNEPSEDIWINQNKAAHRLVAKLNDNIIKAFLKTLK